MVLQPNKQSNSIRHLALLDLVSPQAKHCVFEELHNIRRYAFLNHTLGIQWALLSKVRNNTQNKYLYTSLLFRTDQDVSYS